MGTHVHTFDNQELREFPSDDLGYFPEIRGKVIWSQGEVRSMPDWKNYRFEIKILEDDELINQKSVIVILGGDEDMVELCFQYSLNFMMPVLPEPLMYS